MLSKSLAGLLGVGLLVCGTALASHRTASAVTITSAKVTAKWNESYMKGSLSFTGTSDAAIQLEASVRSVVSHKLVAKPLGFTASGAFSKKITLGARPIPGKYTLTLANNFGSKQADRVVTIPAPPEGVIDDAYMTRTKNGPPAKVIKNAKTIYAHFHFVARPTTNTLTFNWRKPGNPKVRFTGYAKKPYKTNISTFVCVKSTAGGSCLNVPLRKGKWYCIVYAKGKVVKRQDVLVT
jgi:hypothetical protein